MRNGLQTLLSQVSPLRRIVICVAISFIIAAGVLSYSYHAVFQPERPASIAEMPIEDVLKLAGQGNAEAQFVVGWHYEKGTEGVSVDLGKAAGWYRRAAEQGHMEAQNNLGSLLSVGNGVEKNLGKAVHWWRKSANLGNEVAMVNLGRAYLDGSGVNQDFHKAAFWFKKAADLGFPPAQRFLGDLYFEGQGLSKNETEGLAWLRAAAEGGDARAQYELFRKYSHAEGVEKDLVQAGYWYRRFADQGNPDAQAYLEKAAQACDAEAEQAATADWCTFAAGSGSPIGQFQMGGFYHRGHIFERDRTEALSWFRKAAEQGHSGAQLLLGMAYANGDGAQMDLVESYAWVVTALSRKPFNELQSEKEREEVFSMATALLTSLRERLSKNDLRRADQKAKEYTSLYTTPR